MPNTIQIVLIAIMNFKYMRCMLLLRKLTTAYTICNAIKLLVT